MGPVRLFEDQRSALLEFGVPGERIYFDDQREVHEESTGWESVLEAVVAGDVVCVMQVDRFARSVGRGIQMLHAVRQKEVGIAVINLRVGFTDEGVSFDDFWVIMNSFDEWVREASRRYTAAPGGRQAMFSVAEGHAMLRLYRDGWTRGRIAEEFEASLGTVDKYMRLAEAELEAEESEDFRVGVGVS